MLPLHVVDMSDDEKSIHDEGEEYDTERYSLRKDPPPSRKKLENDALQLSEALHILIRKIRKLWVVIDESYEANETSLVTEKQLELETLNTQSKELFTKFKVLKSYDSWGIFDSIEYSALLIKEPYIESETISALQIGNRDAKVPRPLERVKEACLNAAVSVTGPSSAHGTGGALCSSGMGGDREGRQLRDDSSYSGVASHASPTPSPPGPNFSASFLQEIFLRQHLPKVTPDVFSGEPTRFHAWRSSFRAMIQGTNLSPEQEVVYLLTFTSGKPKGLVETYRNRRMDPDSCLKQLWQELQRRFGSPAVVANTYLDKLVKSAAFKQGDRLGLQVFSDLCEDVASQMDVLQSLSCLDFPTSASSVYGKLPDDIKRKWNKRILSYADDHEDQYPPFRVFVRFITGLARLENHPNVLYCTGNKGNNQVNATKTSRRLPDNQPTADSKQTSSKTSAGSADCPFHTGSVHPLEDCRVFRRLDYTAKNEVLRSRGLCYRCLGSNPAHLASSCKKEVKCTVCGSSRHRDVMCERESVNNAKTVSDHDRSEFESERTEQEDDEETAPDSELRVKCVAVCGSAGSTKTRNCSQIILGEVFHPGVDVPAKRVYAILDQQSNSSLMSSSLVDHFGVDAPRKRYILSTCGSEPQETWGRNLGGCKFRGFNGAVMDLPVMTECQIPQTKEEIPLPHLVKHHGHLAHLAAELPEFDPDTGVHILLGRDAPEFLKILESINGPTGAPWAVRSAMGWSILGELCLDSRSSKSSLKSVNKVSHTQLPMRDIDDVFQQSPNDECLSISRDDRKFLDLVQDGIHRNEAGNLEFPLPLRTPRPQMPDNRLQVLHRFRKLQARLARDPSLCAMYKEFMDNIVGKGHVAIARPRDREHSFYIPHFPVFNPKKPGKVRVVFDAACKFKGVSLNSSLLQGPDLLNNLVGILHRFRRGQTAAIIDVECCFHGFFVNSEDRQYLRFFWVKGDDVTSEPVEFEANVHLFGLCSSPAIANFGLRSVAQRGEKAYGSKAKAFIMNDFYCDDGVLSTETVEEAETILRGARSMMKEFNLNLHKIVSNSHSLLQGFPKEALATDFQSIGEEPIPLQRSLGVIWDVNRDVFTFLVSQTKKPYTRRGALSVIHSVFDVGGWVSPVILRGKLLLREMMRGIGLGWDEPLPAALHDRWVSWVQDLNGLSRIQIPRCIKTFGAARRQLLGFSDASDDAIGICIYLRSTHIDGSIESHLVFAQSKLAPKHANSTPRMELCAAVLLAKQMRSVKDQLMVSIDEVLYFSDSTITLGYIQNDSRRFLVYVANRVQCIRNLSEPEQWKHVGTTRNPADIASRGASPEDLTEFWFRGPEEHSRELGFSAEFPLQEDDRETKRVFCTSTDGTVRFSERFCRFSSWKSLVRGVARIRKFLSGSTAGLTSSDLASAETKILELTQREYFPPISPRTKRIKVLDKLNPFIDHDGLLRVGGRLRLSELSEREKHPIILPKKSHVSRLLVLNAHERIHHQGRLITAGAVRDAGFWILGSKHIVGTIIHNCVFCRKLRRSSPIPRMADLPVQRTEKSAPFTHVGIDVFGEWSVIHRRTRAGKASTKRWGLVITCLYCRAVHIETLESLSMDSFICALRRFIAIRGQISSIYCDNGTNFTAGSKEFDRIELFTREQGIEWHFNPPYSSHYGGVFERQIRTIRQVMNNMFKEFGETQITTEVLSTFFAEATAIVNSRPIVSVSSDPEAPGTLSPYTLLTGKTRPIASTGDFQAEDMYARQWWKRAQYLADQFWARWRKEYLSSLQVRQKWSRPAREFQIGDVVLVKDIQLPRYQWPLALVIGTSESHDNVVRRVTVRMGLSQRSFSRAAHSLVLLVACPDQSLLGEKSGPGV